MYNLLKDFSEHMQVYRRGDIPDRFFYKNGPFVSRITCVADLGWSIIQVRVRDKRGSVDSALDAQPEDPGPIPLHPVEADYF